MSDVHIRLKIEFYSSRNVKNICEKYIPLMFKRQEFRSTIENKICFNSLIVRLSTVKKETDKLRQL